MPGKFEKPRSRGGQVPPEAGDQRRNCQALPESRNPSGSRPAGREGRTTPTKSSAGETGNNQPAAGRHSPGQPRSPGENRPAAPAAGEGRPYPPVRRSGRKKKSLPGWLPIAGAACVLLLALVLLFRQCGADPQPPAETLPTQPPVTTQATQAKPVLEDTATVLVQGDMLMHSYLFTGNPKYPAASYLAEGSYDFQPMFQYVQSYVQEADYAVANLETTLGGPEKPYSGNPLFNCPDALADALKATGYDMLLTANNHCHDTGIEGLRRTLEQLRSRDLATLGTQMDDSEKKYQIVDINGIQVGMICYTYAAGLESNGNPNLNFKPETVVKETGVVNYFTENKLDEFYTQLEAQLQQMKQEGAQMLMVYLHWGQEYKLTESQVQRTMGQKLCDLGVDVIVGGHPHVVEPMELFTSTTDPEHHTVCIYSLGNALSNQRREEMKSMPEGHTEDGAMFQVTFGRYSDGTVAVTNVEVIPTWVHKYTNDQGKVEYRIYPLDVDTREQWKSLYGITDGVYNQLTSSYTRTMDIVQPGLEKCLKSIVR